MYNTVIYKYVIEEMQHIYSSQFVLHSEMEKNEAKTMWRYEWLVTFLRMLIFCYVFI